MQHILAICAGASIGALCRWQLGNWLNTAAGMPWGTLAANAIGGYAIGLCMAFFQSQPGLDPVWKLAIITGFLGALTTFSSYSAEVITFLQQGRLGLAAAWAASHLGASLLLTFAGLHTFKALHPAS